MHLHIQLHYSKHKCWLKLSHLEDQPSISKYQEKAWLLFSTHFYLPSLLKVKKDQKEEMEIVEKKCQFVFSAFVKCLMIKIPLNENTPSYHYKILPQSCKFIISNTFKEPAIYVRICINYMYLIIFILFRLHSTY